MYVTPYKSYDLFNQYILKPTKLTIRCKQRKSSLNGLVEYCLPPPPNGVLYTRFSDGKYSNRKKKERTKKKRDTEI